MWLKKDAASHPVSEHQHPRVCLLSLSFYLCLYWWQPATQHPRVCLPLSDSLSHTALYHRAQPSRSCCCSVVSLLRPRLLGSSMTSLHTTAAAEGWAGLSQHLPFPGIPGPPASCPGPDIFSTPPFQPAALFMAPEILNLMVECSALGLNMGFHQKRHPPLPLPMPCVPNQKNNHAHTFPLCSPPHTKYLPCLNP